MEIIVTGTNDKPYFKIKYKEVGKEYYNIGYSSYYLNKVFDWKEKYFEIVNELAEEHKGGWIPCSERLPDKRDWYLAVFQEADTGFIGLPFIADYLMGVHTKYTTEDGWIIANCTDIEEGRAEYYKKLKCVAWQPLPGKYIPKGEQ